MWNFKLIIHRDGYDDIRLYRLDQADQLVADMARCQTRGYTYEMIEVE